MLSQQQQPNPGKRRRGRGDFSRTVLRALGAALFLCDSGAFWAPNSPISVAVGSKGALHAGRLPSSLGSGCWPGGRRGGETNGVIRTPLRCGTEFMSNTELRGSLPDDDDGHGAAGRAEGDVRERRGRAPLQYDVGEVEEQGRRQDVVDALVEKLRESKSAGSRESCIRQLKEETKKGDVRTITAVCDILDNMANNAVMVREEAVSCLAKVSGGVGGEADATAFRTLIRSAQHDNAHVVRRGAFELLKGLIVGAEEQQEAIALAMTHLRKEDLRGEPLFKPNGDPLSLCTEAALTVGAFARKGNTEVWRLLERRLMDDSVAGTRAAAARALAEVADGDVMASGGARTTVHALALGARDPSPEVASACKEALCRLITSEGMGKYYG